MISGGFTPGRPSRKSYSIDTLTDGPLTAQTTVAATQVFPGANVSIFVPVTVDRRVTVRKLWYGNGTTATGNYDIGLYTSAGVSLLLRGSTAKTTSASEIVWDCTDTVIDAGLYYLALASDSATDTFLGVAPAAPICAALGLYTEAAFPLASTATFAVPHTLAFYPTIGMLLNTVVS
jgi:hypothetical protein